MTPEEQLDLWVAGKPVHNPDRDECCPDFSCCNPELLADLDTRTVFKAANQKKRENMLFEFLGKLLAANFTEGEVHLLVSKISRDKY